MPLAAPQQIDTALRQVRDQTSFINKLLVQTLQWPVAGKVESIEDLAYGWSKEDLSAAGLDQQIVDGNVWQIQPLSGNQPWGIFLLEFERPDAFVSGRGMTGPLRQVLRGLVPNRRRASDARTWKREHLLFICTHNYEHYRIAYFKTPTEGSSLAPLAAFGWGPDVPARTACEFNLPALTWPDQPAAAGAWVGQWSAAFDVEKVTQKFYEHYASAFAEVENLIGPKAKVGSDEDLRMFTQTLFNRLMFLRFIERKGWLTFDGRTDYLRALFQAGGIGGESLYRSRIRPLFFEGLAVEGKQTSKAVGEVPFLNGGLFEENDLDRKAKDVPDTALAPMIGPTGLFYRYNFTIEESTPLDIEVAVDPEMLGKVFEELVTGRHESGSYYTPRPVVSFMCREALKGYLADKAAASADAIAKLVDEHTIAGLTETHAREILTALDDVKAVDPACGSGAYLLGLLHELVAIYRLLYSERLARDSRSLYDLKLRIISHNLYGVDIDPFATNIAMLRLWLSLAVEADEPVPLPNLDFKIETGDSLLAPNPQEMPDLFRSRVQKAADAIASAKAAFVTAHGPKKDELHAQIDASEAELQQLIRDELPAGSVDWRIQFAEVFAPRSGFDVVLMNPPYVATYSRQSEKAAVADERALREAYGAFGGRLNLFTCFIARALQLANSNGSVAFIVPDSYATSDSYKLVRAAFRSAYGRQAWTLIKPAVFGANVRNVVVAVSCGEERLRTVVVSTESDLPRIQNLHASAIDTIWGTNDRVAFFSGLFEEQLWNQIKANPLRLEEHFVTRDGVNPGPRTVRDRIVNPSTGGRKVRPLITGTQIDGAGFRVHPAVDKILYDEGAITAAERKAGASLRDPEVFRSPKIVSRQTADTLIAGIDESESLVTLNSVHCTRAQNGDLTMLWGLLALLNSPLARLFYAIDGGETRELLPQVHISWIREFPLPGDVNALLSKLAPFAQAIHSDFDNATGRRHNLRQIHEFVCRSYGVQGDSDAVLAAYLGRYPRYAADWNTSATEPPGFTNRSRR